MTKEVEILRNALEHARQNIIFIRSELLNRDGRPVVMKSLSLDTLTGINGAIKEADKVRDANDTRKSCGIRGCVHCAAYERSLKI